MSKSPSKITDHDLRQMSDDWLNTLAQAQLLDLSGRLLRDLREARDRLNQTPSNSSRPPSSMAPWQSTTRDDGPGEPSSPAPAPGPSVAPEAPPAVPDGAAESGSAEAAARDGTSNSPSNRPSGKKAGKQRGSQGFGRTQKLPITRTEHHHAKTCAGCGDCLRGGTSVPYTGWDEVDIADQCDGQVGLFIEVIHHLLHAHTCHCGHVTRATHHAAPDDPLWDKVKLGQWRLIGPRLAAGIVFLAMRMRLSRARIREFFGEFLGLALSTGAIDEAIREAGRATAPLEEDIADQIEQAALAHADETPWKEKGQPLWMWVFVCAHTTLFLIGSRSMEILSNVLTSKFTGNLMTDGYKAYRHMANRLRCWAHLVRKLQGLTESTDARVAGAGKTMLDLLCTLMEAIYVARTLPDQEYGALASKYAVEIAHLKTLCELHRDDPHGKLRSVAVEFLLDWDVIMRQVSEPHLPLTNNAAEQALRHWVIARRICQGTRSEAGTRAFAMLASVIETCRKRSASPYRFLATVIVAARNGLELPSLPPIPVGV